MGLEVMPNFSKLFVSLMAAPLIFIGSNSHSSQKDMRNDPNQGIKNAIEKVVKKLEINT